ncbi:MAG: FkbM family methyltransferase [Rhizobiales bacterium TMED94]|mgnify:FL=1|nr:MAG: FkbM family methyltransferase [Rhizobiales bacterium TMED94]
MSIKINFEQFKETLVDLPFFVFRHKKVENLNLISKLLFLIKSKVIILIYKLFNEKLYCFFMNLFYKKDGKISFSQSHKTYLKHHENNQIHYPNKTRILGSMVNHNYELDNLLYSYGLESFKVEKDDLIIDCGANVGNLFLSINRFIENFNYKAFEPDPKAFKCLELNLNKFKNADLHCIGLSNENKNKKFYINADTGDSSLEAFNTEISIDIETRELDSYKYEKIKLLKIDAEGHELEVLLGAKKTLSNIEYISVDMGAEKGEGTENTVALVTNFLISQNFGLVDFKESRTTGLFKNLIYN